MRLAKTRRPLLLALFLIGALLSAMGLVGAADFFGEELDLHTPDGTAYEVRRDEDGNLWVSDFKAGEIWQVDPTGTSYTIFAGLDGASDAHSDGNGVVWYSNYDDNALGKLTLGSNTAVNYPLSGTGSPWGISIDGSGLIWVTDAAAPLIHSFNPITKERCAYTVPDDGASDYIVSSAGVVWIGDLFNERILRLNPSLNQFTVWQLDEESWPRGLDLDDNGNLWWADKITIGRLEPGENRITNYAVPDPFPKSEKEPIYIRDIRNGRIKNAPDGSTSPVMVDYHDGSVWYTDDSSGLFGSLNPAIATGTSNTVAPTTSPVSPSCTPSVVGSPVSLSVSTNPIVWTSRNYSEITNSGGWNQYQLPDSPIAGTSWGVAVAPGNVWIVDQGRQKLLRKSDPDISVYLPMIIK